MKAIHYTKEIDFKPRHIDIKNGRLPSKPFGGIWASPLEAEYGWKQYCEEEASEFINKYAVILTIDTSHFITIDSEADLRQLKWYKNPVIESEYIDFESLKNKGTDGVYLTSRGQGNTRLTHPRNLYGWDCESVLIMNERCILNVEKLDKLPSTFRSGEGPLTPNEEASMPSWYHPLKSESIEGDLIQSAREEAKASADYRKREEFAESRGDKAIASLYKDTASDEDAHFKEFTNQLKQVEKNEGGLLSATIVYINVSDPGETELAKGTIVALEEFEKANRRAEQVGVKKASGYPTPKSVVSSEQVGGQWRPGEEIPRVDRLEPATERPASARRPKQEDDLEFIPDSPEYLAETISTSGWRDKIDEAFQAAIQRVRG